MKEIKRKPQRIHNLAKHKNNYEINILQIVIGEAINSLLMYVSLSPLPLLSYSVSSV